METLQFELCKAVKMLKMNVQLKSHEQELSRDARQEGGQNGLSQALGRSAM
jgi:hypothetical protein